MDKNPLSNIPNSIPKNYTINPYEYKENITKFKFILNCVSNPLRVSWIEQLLVKVQKKQFESNRKLLHKLLHVSQVYKPVTLEIWRKLFLTTNKIAVTLNTLPTEFVSFIALLLFRNNNDLHKELTEVLIMHATEFFTAQNNIEEQKDSEINKILLKLEDIKHQVIKLQNIKQENHGKSHETGLTQSYLKQMWDRF